MPLRSSVDATQRCVRQAECQQGANMATRLRWTLDVGSTVLSKNNAAKERTRVLLNVAGSGVNANKRTQQNATRPIVRAGRAITVDQNAMAGENGGAPTTVRRVARRPGRRCPASPLIIIQAGNGATMKVAVEGARVITERREPEEQRASGNQYTRPVVRFGDRHNDMVSARQHIRLR